MSQESWGWFIVTAGLNILFYYLIPLLSEIINILDSIVLVSALEGGLLL